MQNVLTASAARPITRDSWQHPHPERAPERPREEELLHHLFERQADANPDGTAIASGTTRLSYRTLERHANRIARRLRSLGVRRGSRVGLLLPRSVEAYAAMLGILKAGAAYIPLDPEWPAERIAFILGDAWADALVTLDAFAGAQEAFGGTLLRADADAASIAAESPARLTPRETGATSHDLCYLIYTSGSTGRPKGVMIEHHSACHLVKVEGELFGVAAFDRVLQGASLAFDLSVEEIWLAFHAGATLVPASPELMHSGPDFGRLLADAAITVLSCVPTLLASVATDAPSVRLLILGGEVCPDALVRRWARGGRRVVNTYGPTESTVTATYCELDPARRVSIGRALPGYRVHLLDEQLRPVPEGAIGEICVGGSGVARGYVGLDAQTHERFVSDPFDDTPDARLYRTGDLGRLTASGDLQFVGRGDGQVKLRGFRIELEEIEAVLAECDGVLTAACVVRGSPGSEQLVGYVVMQDGTDVELDEIRSSARARLPVYMVPALIERISALPRRSSGKLDRDSLPAPTARAAVVAPQGRGPRTATEKHLALVWRALVEPLPVSIDDDFFTDLGGHSMLAARMVSELRKEPRLARVSMVDVYAHPTIARLAAAIDAAAFAELPAHRTVRTSARAFREAAQVLHEERASFRAPRLRHVLAGTAQAFALYLPLGLRAAEWCAPYLVFFLLIATERSFAVSFGWAMLAATVAFPALLVVALVTKWLVIGRIRAGRYPLWGSYHLRWWFARAVIDCVPLDYLTGTPLLPFIYRLFGARIGRDVHLSTDHLFAYDLITIGDESNVDDDVFMNGAEVEDGELVLGPITIGKRCHVGTRCALREGTVLDDDARLEDLTLLPRGTRVPPGETWAGAPARAVQRQPRDLPPRPVRSLGIRMATTACYLLGALMIPCVMLLTALPGLSILLQLDPLGAPLTYIAVVPLVGAIFSATLALAIVALKRLLVGRVQPGRYAVHGSFYVRNWIVDQLLRLGRDMLGQVHATLYAAPWYRALGARLGQDVEFSTASETIPDLVEIEDGGTIADEVSLGAARVEGGWMTLAKTHIGRRAFAGNSAVVPSGATLGDGALVGVLSLAPTSEPGATAPDSAWLGSPPIRLPRRQQSADFPVERTYRPSARRRRVRRIVELLRVTMPSAGFVLVSATVITATFALRDAFGLVAALALAPISYAIAAVAALLVVALAKWAIDGRFKRFVHPLWSVFVWRLEFVNALYEFFATPILLESLRGTPFLPWYLRLLGARIGRRTYIDTTGFLEYDLVEIGDEAMLNDDCVMQTHLFEDRVLKASRVKVGAGCSVGTASVVLYDAVLEPGARLDALSLVMKGETLPAGTAWSGVPATWHDWRDLRSDPTIVPLHVAEERQDAVA